MLAAKIFCWGIIRSLLESYVFFTARMFVVVVVVVVEYNVIYKKTLTLTYAPLLSCSIFIFIFLVSETLSFLLFSFFFNLAF